MRVTVTFDTDGEAVQVSPNVTAVTRQPAAWVTALNLRLTPRELEVMRMAATGMQYKQIADVLEISETTVRTHMNNAYAQTGLQNVAMLVTYAWLTGLIDDQYILRAWRDFAPHLVRDGN